MDSQLSIRLPEELHRKISSLAEELGLKRSDVVRMALQRFVEGIRKEKPRKLYDRAKHLLGSTSSGIPDLGSAHRKHLLDRFKRNA